MKVGARRDSTEPMSFRDFDSMYQKAVQSILVHFSADMQAQISVHNYGWRVGATDFGDYLRVSSIRYYHAYRLLAQREPSQSVCDIGGFWGVFPITLARLGFTVTMTETLRYYGSSFDGLFQRIADEGVTVIDYDPFEEHTQPPGRFDFVTVMAVIEHYPHSLRPFMGNVVSMLKPDARLYLEVPNIVSWPKRVDMLFGRTPLTPITDIYRSAIPFIGHHHEFTMAELRDVVRMNELTVIAEMGYRFPPASLRTWLRRPLESLICFSFKHCREVLALLCRNDQRRRLPSPVNHL